ncbi:sulfurtransferase complex subunit TusC [Pseudomonas sp.]|jgi:tRNA 2-thiouridine synthesizing protein C|uniref:sulfurtransferase complex subunit TusC n=1 Tax=Pseudomonas sp. TaxID=306 RepID=UPI00272BF7BE|nr:sulfurtransferase complex subunit TusC [Pseudomonas sp.]
MRSLLVISRQPPTHLAAREALDLALAAAAFGVPTGMLFMADGVLQLAKGQDASRIDAKSLTANLQALPMFGVDELFACSLSLKDRGLTSDRCMLPARPIDSTEIAALLENYDQVVTL